MNYLPVNVFVNSSYGDCSNNGITATHSNRLVVECPTGHITEEDVINRDLIVLVPRVLGGKTNLVARDINTDKWCMFGGNFVWTSDSRFPFDAPMPVHDRIEG